MTMPVVNQSGDRGWYWRLALLVMVGAVLRVAVLLVRPDVMETEGQCYVRIAENLAAGLGQLGIREEGLQLFYAPLYPWLIATLLKLGLSASSSAHLISLIAGTATIVPVAMLGRIAFSPRVGLVAGLMVVLHPALIVTSGSTLAEALFLFLLTSAVAACALSLYATKLRAPIAGGVFAGLAYLVRPEGLAICALGAIILLLGVRGTFATRLRIVAPFVMSFLLLALPYVGYLAVETGRLRLETKSPENLLIGDRASRGVPEPEIYFGIDKSLNGTGTSMRSNLEVMQEADLANSDRIHFLRTLGIRNIVRGIDTFFTSRALGQPILAGLAFLGFFATAWTRVRMLAMALPLGLACLTFAALGTLHLFWVRYLFPVLPWLIVLAAAGLVHMAATVRETFSVRVPAGGLAKFLSIGVAVIVFALTVGISLRGLGEIGEFSEAWAAERLVLRDAGARLRSDNARLRVADIDPTVAYYANATFEFLPYTDPDAAVRYLDRRGIDYLVLRKGPSMIPYLQDWYRDGPPAGKVSLAFTMGDVRVYRWLR